MTSAEGPLQEINPSYRSGRIERAPPEAVGYLGWLSEIAQKKSQKSFFFHSSGTRLLFSCFFSTTHTWVARPAREYIPSPVSAANKMWQPELTPPPHLPRELKSWFSLGILWDTPNPGRCASTVIGSVTTPSFRYRRRLFLLPSKNSLQRLRRHKY